MNKPPKNNLPKVQYSSQPEVTYIHTPEDESRMQEQLKTITKILSEADQDEIKLIKTIHFDQKISVVIHPPIMTHVDLK